MLSDSELRHDVAKLTQGDDARRAPVGHDTLSATADSAETLEADLRDLLGRGLIHHDTQARRFETYSMEVVAEEVMTLADDESRQPDVQVEEAEFMSVVTEKISELPEREQLVMQLYYVEELNLKEIGEVLGVSESRISQILSTVVKKLRHELKMG